MTPVRRAGWGRDATGAEVWWTVADGRRGRRWRESVVRHGAIIHSLLLETDPERRFAHVELATPAGLLTLHPEGDGTLHGNAVRAGGLEHVTGLTWSADGLVLVEGSSIACAAAMHALSAARGRRDGWTTLVISLRLERSLQEVAVVQLAAELWRIAALPPMPVDQDGIPELIEGRAWPLEESGTG